MNFLLVAIGGALGSVLRYIAVQHVVMRLHPEPFPLGTLLVNVVGSLLIGMVMAKFMAQGLSDNARLFLVTGVLGGFTTFSAFSWDVLQLIQRGQLGQAALYVLGSVGLSLAAVALGLHLVR